MGEKEPQDIYIFFTICFENSMLLLKKLIPKSWIKLWNPNLLPLYSIAIHYKKFIETNTFMSIDWAA